jgi:ribosomal protein S18 acetylase RimI-like enzyme
LTVVEFRRSGIARALLAAAEDQALAMGLPGLALDTNLDNGPARSLYESSGFAEWARRPPAKETSGLVFYVKYLRALKPNTDNA